MEIVRKPSNYGWPICYSTQARLLQVELPRVAVGTPLTPTSRAACRPTIRRSRSTAAAPTIDQRLALEPQGRPGQRARPARAARRSPIRSIWYSYNDNRAANPLGTPCFGYYATTPGADRARVDAPSARGCSRSSYTGNVGPHGAAKYNYDPANPSTKKFPPYYDNSVIIGEFTRDTLREVKLDEQNRVFKINGFLDCGRQPAEPEVRVRVRQPDGHAVRQRTARSTC